MGITIESDRVDAVLFDMGGIFVLPEPAIARSALRAVHLHEQAAADDESFRRAHFAAMRAHDEDRPDDADIGRHYLSAYFGALGVLGADLEAALEAVQPAWDTPASQRWIWRQDEAASALEHLAAHGTALAIVSNCDGTAAEILEIASVCQVGPGAGTPVAVIVDSAVVGSSKPDPAIFQPALTALGVDPDRVVYVGDSLRFDVGGALAAGLHPVQLDPYDLYEGLAHDRIRSLLELVDHLCTTPDPNDRRQKGLHLTPGSADG